ncbi:MAG: DMT family transporter [Firmicutes bacterium]|nr:DMT family transporter [Bacillota bacterium]
MGKQMRGIILLLITTMLWGCSFVAQRTSVDAVDAFTFNTGRMCSAFLAMVVVVLVRSSLSRRKGRLTGAEVWPPKITDMKSLLIGGLLCGLSLNAGIACMQLGIMTTSAGKTGFETALYIIEVPIFSILIGQRPRKIQWLCVVIAVIGLWLLAVQPGTSMTLAKGDIILLIGTVFFALQIMFMDHYVEKADPMLLSTLQFGVGAIAFPILMFIFEEPTAAAFMGELLPMLYAGVMSSAAGFTLAAYAQKDVDPTLTSLLMSLEGVFAVIGAWVLIHEHLAARELLGCAIMFAAIIITQLPERKTNG